MDETQVRAAALTSASRAVEPGQSVDYFLSTARRFARYIETGQYQNGPRGRHSLDVNDDVTVQISGPLLDEVTAQRVVFAVRDAL